MGKNMSIWNNKHIDRAVRRLVDELERHFLMIEGELLNTDERRVAVVTPAHSFGERAVLSKWFECPNCGSDMVTQMSNYCPNCGCRLRHLDEGNDVQEECACVG